MERTEKVMEESGRLCNGEQKDEAAGGVGPGMAAVENETAAEEVMEEEERGEALPPLEPAPLLAPQVDKVGDQSAAASATPAQQPEPRPTEASPKKTAHPPTSPASQVSARPQTSCSSLPTQTAPGPYLTNGVRGGRFGTGMPKSDVEWTIYRAKQLPGPGQYGVPSRRLSGGRFSTCNPKTDVECQMIRASKIPAPGQYDIRDHVPNGGRFSNAVPKSDLEWKMIRAAQVTLPTIALARRYHARLQVLSSRAVADLTAAAQIPGPGEYAVTKHERVNGGRLSTSAIVTDVDICMRRAKKLPGPGAYDVSYGSKKSGGRFSTSKPKTDVEWLMYRAKQIPGPGEYDRKLKPPSGGKFGASTPKTNLEELMDRAAKLPGPGMYDNDIYSIGRRTGAVSPYPSSASTSKPVTPQLSQHSGIPPEARRKPKPKKLDLEEAPAGPRPHTSLGLVSDGATGEVHREVHRSRTPELEPLSGKEEQQTKHKVPWYKRGASRESVRSRSPAKWNIPESAQRAYGVWLDEAPRKKKNKGRSKTGDDGKSGPIVIKVHVDSVNPGPGADGNYDIEALDHELPVINPNESTTDGTGNNREEIAPEEWAANAPKRDHLSANAQKLFDLAMKSNEFREMMQLYTGMQDPTSIIEKYAEMWAKQPLAANASRKKQPKSASSATKRPSTSMQ